ncbi:Hypothetical_protein [Hexamita inflata]|uniref:Hypothetical_protein n=1 Tax=Hexamita inflata TaxID=28002 RepID=A0AA86V2Q4_9EUKA|nr:Hypothetical protein HINF_LOCUS43143 [Hexamita inflata]
MIASFGLFTNSLDRVELNYQVPESWFGSYNRYCFSDNDDSGQYQGMRMSGTYVNRLTKFAANIKDIQITNNFVFSTKLEQYYVTKFANQLLKTKLVGFSLLFGCIFVIVMIVVYYLIKYDCQSVFFQLEFRELAWVGFIEFEIFSLIRFCWYFGSLYQILEYLYFSYHQNDAMYGTMYGSGHIILQQNILFLQA